MNGNNIHSKGKQMSSTVEVDERKPETAKARQSSGDPASAPPEVLLTRIMLGALAAQALYVPAKLGIADLLAAGPKSVEDLATATDTDAPALYRILRAAASLGVFAEQENRTFALNANAEPLLSNRPNSLRDMTAPCAPSSAISRSYSRCDRLTGSLGWGIGCSSGDPG